MNCSSTLRVSQDSQESEISNARYSRKVFAGGLPRNIHKNEISAAFLRFGPLIVDWPYKSVSNSNISVKGYAFLIFQKESSVQQLVQACTPDNGKLYFCVSSQTIKDKPAEIIPWCLDDSAVIVDSVIPLDPRNTVFVNSLPKPLKAIELAMSMDHLYGGVCYVGIDTDPDYKYPKGTAKVIFANQENYVAAISERFFKLKHGNVDKNINVRPYVLFDQTCDECKGRPYGRKFAPYFCPNVKCLKYYCEYCWINTHSLPPRKYHKHQRQGSSISFLRSDPFRWC